MKKFGLKIDFIAKLVFLCAFFYSEGIFKIGFRLSNPLWVASKDFDKLITKHKKKQTGYHFTIPQIVVMLSFISIELQNIFDFGLVISWHEFDAIAIGWRIKRFIVSLLLGLRNGVKFDLVTRYVTLTVCIYNADFYEKLVHFNMAEHFNSFSERYIWHKIEKKMRPIREIENFQKHHADIEFWSVVNVSVSLMFSNRNPDFSKKKKKRRQAAIDQDKIIE